MRRRFTRNESGFTLIELMIVMVIITILAGIGLAVYGNSLRSAKEATLKEDLFRMRDAINQYYADKNRYPATLEALVEDKYLRRCHLIHSHDRQKRGRRHWRNPNPAIPLRKSESTM